MKKSIFLTFVLAAGFAATFLTGCGDDSAVSGCIDVTGTDTGSHKVYIGSIAAPLSPIQDTLTASVSGSNVTIESKALGRDLTGTIDASDCNKVNLDSVIFVPGDTLFINSTTLGLVKIWGIRGGGSGTINSAGVNTSITISKGATNITSPINLTNLNGLGLNLKGTFKKIP